MKVLVVCSYNRGQISPFISEQVKSLRESGVLIEFFLIRGKGAFGYLRNIPSLKNGIKYYAPDLIHAHFGLTGLLCNLQRKVPVITTFHGCDINVIWLRILSAIPLIFSKHCIFVSKEIARKSYLKRGYSIIPSGIDLELFYPIEKVEARSQLKLDNSAKLVLFSGSFNEKVKNYQLALSAIKLIKGVKLIELKGYSRNEVNLLINACDVALLTSFREGSPQFIKEAMACNCPIVSTDVGDIRSMISGIDGCFIADFDPNEIALKIKKALDFAVQKKKTNGRARIKVLKYDIVNISQRIIEQYQKVID